MVLTPAQRALAYAKRDEGGVASQLIKEKKFKELVDRIFETGDFDLFKADVKSSVIYSFYSLDFSDLSMNALVISVEDNFLLLTFSFAD